MRGRGEVSVAASRDWQKCQWQEMRQMASILLAMGGQLKVIEHGGDMLRFVL